MDINESNEAGKKKKLAREANEAAFADLTLSCQVDVSFGIVTRSTTKELPEGDAKLAWDNLKQRFYQQDSSAALVALKTEYNESKLESVTDDPEDWITYLEKIVKRLGKMELKVSSHDLKMHILNNLPPE